MNKIEEEIYNALEKDWNGYSKEDAARIATESAIGFIRSKSIEAFHHHRRLAKKLYRKYIDKAIADALEYCRENEVPDTDEFIEQWHEANGMKREI